MAYNWRFHCTDKLETCQEGVKWVVLFLGKAGEKSMAHMNVALWVVQVFSGVGLQRNGRDESVRIREVRSDDGEERAERDHAWSLASFIGICELAGAFGVVPNPPITWALLVVASSEIESRNIVARMTCLQNRDIEIGSLQLLK